MKGITGIEIVIIGLIFIVAIVVVIIMPIPFLKVHLIRTIEFEFEYNYAESTFLAFMSSTHNGRPVIEIIAERILLNNPPDVNFLKGKLDSIVESKSFKLSFSEGVLISSGSPSKYKTNGEVVLPYNPIKLVKELTLVID